MLYGGVIRDRPRVALSVYEAVDMYGAPGDLLMIRVSNRGRRDLSIENVSRIMDVRRGHTLWIRELGEAVRAGPDAIGDGRSHTYVLGPIGYHAGKLPLTRWYVADGAGRIYPLRARYRLRAESFVLWPLRTLLRRRDSRRSISQP
jgi:hypothetical protein